MREKSKYFKMNRYRKGFVFKLFIFLQHGVFLTFYAISRKTNGCSCVPYNGSCFDKVVALFKSGICDFEFSVRVNCP